MSEQPDDGPSLGRLYAQHSRPPVMPEIPGSLGQLYAQWSGEVSNALADRDTDLPVRTVDTRRRRHRTRQPAPGTDPVVAAPPVPPAQAGGSAAGPLDVAAEPSVLRSSAVMAAGTLVSRVLGLLRSILLAAALGKTAASFNIFDVANKMPNMIYILLAGGVINAVLVPQITRAMKHPDGGRAYTDRLLTLALSILGGVTIVLMAGSPLLYKLFDLGATGAQWKLGTLFTLFCLPQVFFYGVYTLFGETLNARSNFGPLMWSPALANVIQIAGLIWFIAITSQPRMADPANWTMPLVLLLAGTTTLGILAQAVVLIWPMHHVGYHYRPRFQFRGVGLRSASRVAGWAFAAVVLQQAVMLVTTNVLMVHVSGVSGSGAQSYAFLLFMLPHSLVTLSLVTALYTRMSKAAGAGRTGEVIDDVRTVLRLSGLAGVAVTVGCIVLVPPLVSTMFGPYQSFAISSPTIAMMLGIVPFTVCVVAQRAFYAYEDAKTPFKMQMVCTVVAAGCSLLALLLPAQWIGAGVAAAQSISYLVEAVIGFGWLRRFLGALPIRDVAGMYGRLGVAAVAATLVALGVRVGLSIGVGDATRAQNLLIIAVGGAAFAAIYAIVARRLGVHEIDQLAAPITRRLRRAA